MWFLHLAILLLTVVAAVPGFAQVPERWDRDWPRTDFTRTAVPLDEIRPGGAARDEMPPIDAPRFVSVGAADVPGIEPVVSLVIGGDARAYPLRVLIWHQIVNDVIGGVPVAVTYCPLCNAALVFDRRFGADVLEFGTTGLLRYSGLLMYDRQTESWWQQYEGQAIVGALAGARVKQVASRLESMRRFAERFPDGRVLVPADPGFRPYGRNPFTGYDRMPSPSRFEGPLPDEVEPLSRVVSVGDRAWSLALLRQLGHVDADGLLIEWSPGQSSALDAKRIAEGRDIGNVVVRTQREGGLVDVPYSVEFAFVFKAFHPGVAIAVE